MCIHTYTHTYTRVHNVSLRYGLQNLLLNICMRVFAYVCTHTHICCMQSFMCVHTRTHNVPSSCEYYIPTCAHTYIYASMHTPSTCILCIHAYLHTKYIYEYIHACTYNQCLNTSFRLCIQHACIHSTAYIHNQCSKSSPHLMHTTHIRTYIYTCIHTWRLNLSL